MFISLKNIYNSTPKLIQPSFSWFYQKLPNSRLKYGKGYVYIKKLLETTKDYSREQIQEYQFKYFLSIYRHAINKIPYYKKWYRKFGLTEDSIRHPEDIKKIPYLTKDILRKNLEDFVLPSFPKAERILKKTGGSTGKPTEFYLSKFINQVYNGFMHNIWARAGYKPFDYKVAFVRCEYLKQDKNIYQYYEPTTNDLYLSLYHLADREYVKKYIDIIRYKPPKYLWGYAGSLYMLTQTIREFGITMPRLKGVLAGSQKLLTGQRELLKKYSEVVFLHGITWQRE